MNYATTVIKFSYNKYIIIRRSGAYMSPLTIYEQRKQV